MRFPSASRSNFPFSSVMKIDLFVKESNTLSNSLRDMPENVRKLAIEFFGSLPSYFFTIAAHASVANIDAYVIARPPKAKFQKFKIIMETHRCLVQVLIMSICTLNGIAFFEREPVLLHELHLRTSIPLEII